MNGMSGTGNGVYYEQVYGKKPTGKKSIKSSGKGIGKKLGK
jgi:hypothetical protein